MVFVSLLLASSLAAQGQVSTLDLRGDAASAVPQAWERAPLVTDQASPFDAEDRHAHVHHDVDANGTCWVRGRGYKASASAMGFSFTPFLGSDAPRNFPLRMQLVEVARGGEEIDLEHGGAAERSGDRIVLQRGAVEVRYDVATEGVEQSFMLESAPGGGDLGLSLKVETELAFTETEDGFRFSNKLGGVDYGAATVFDAVGKSAAVAASWSNGQIQLTVPASFLEGAAWPVVIDPLLTPFTIASGTADLSSPDTAFDRVFNRYTVVFEERFSAADTDLFTYYVGLGMTVTGGTYLDQTAASWSAPRVMTSPINGCAFCVAEADSVAVAGSKDIVGRNRFTDGTLDAPIVVKSAEPSFSCAAPAVGADGDTGTFDAFLVVYNRVTATSRDVYSILMDGVQATMERAIAVGVEAGPPAVSSTSGLCCFAAFYYLAWAQRDPATGEFSVEVAEVFFSGAVNATFTVAGPSTDAFYFDVDVSPASTQQSSVGNRFIYLVTYDDRPSSVTDAFVAVCSGETLLNTYELQLSEHADRTPNQNDLTIATGRDQFMLGYEEDGELILTTVEVVEDQLSILERRRISVGTDLAPGSLAGAGALQFSAQARDGLFVWAQPGGSSSPISGAFVSIPSGYPSSAGIQYCYGTVNSTGDRGFIQVTGSRAIGFPHELRVEALPPNVFGYFLASTTTGNVLNAGGSEGTLCVGGSVGRFGVFQADAAGTGVQVLDTLQIAQPQGPVSAMPFEQWNFQSWYRDAVGGVATSNFTNAVTVPFL